MFRIRTLIIVAILSISFALTAQDRDTEKRTPATRIADLLAKMPARDAPDLEKLMQEMAESGEDGLISITGMITAPGMGDDSRIRYAVNGFSNFVMENNGLRYRQMCERAWCKALAGTEDKEIKAFMISQLQIMGTGDAVESLAGYLSDERLCDPASRALVVINTTEAGTALLKSFSSASGKILISLAQALGDIRNPDAEESLAKLANSGDINTRKTALYALGNIGMEQSADQLYTQAKNAGFAFEPSRATAAYLLWLDRTGEKGNIKLLKKQAERLIMECTGENQVQTRCEALALLVRYTGEKSLSRLLAASDAAGIEYGNAALSLSEGLKGEKVTAAWIKKGARLKDLPKAGIIRMLGNRGDKEAFGFIVASLNDPSREVRLASVISAQKLGGERSLSYLLEFINKADQEEVNCVKQALLIMQGDQVIPEIGKIMPRLEAGPKIAMIEVLASRRASDKLGLVMEQVNEKNPAVRKAAFNALSEMVEQKDLPVLFSLLTKTHEPENIMAIRKAIVSALQGVDTEKAKSEIVMLEMTRADAAMQPRFYAIFPEIGGAMALEVIRNAFATGSGEARDEAIKAFTGWKDAGACRDLYAIMTGHFGKDYQDSSFKAYVRLIVSSAFPADQKLLMLRKAMEVASVSDQKAMILESLGGVRTFTALVFAGGYLDDPVLGSRAATAVMNIALQDTTLFGDITSGLLLKAANKLSGSESDYEREAIRKFLAGRQAANGFVPLFNGKDLSGWKGLVENPVIRSKMAPSVLQKKQKAADDIMRKGWIVKDGILWFGGNGENLCTVKPYGDFEMLVDWKINPGGDAGIYLRGAPQVQIWDASRLDTDAKVGSGGLYNNEVNEKNPLTVADNPVGDWNTFRIMMKGERVTVYLNGLLVVDNIIMENYWDRGIPIFPSEQIELQAHGSLVGYRDIYIREIQQPEPYRVSSEESSEGFKELFDGMSLNNWQGNTKDYIVENGCIVFRPGNGGIGNLYTRKEYRNFILRFEFQLTPAGNSGIGIRAPLNGDAAYGGMEIQVLDDNADVYKNLEQYQYHGSVYGVIPAKRGYLKPVGGWNSEEIFINGNKIKVTLNGMVIVNGDIAEASRNGTLDHKDHPGLKNEKGYIGFLSHDSPVQFRNIRIKTME